MSCCKFKVEVTKIFLIVSLFLLNPLNGVNDFNFFTASLLACVSFIPTFMHIVKCTFFDNTFSVILCPSVLLTRCEIGLLYKNTDPSPFPLGQTVDTSILKTTKRLGCKFCQTLQTRRYLSLTCMQCLIFPSLNEVKPLSHIHEFSYGRSRFWNF